MKFDICLMNPPYGSKTQHTSPHLHLQFVESTLNITNKLVAVFPNRIAFSSSKEYDNFKKVFDDRLEEIEEIDSNVFTGTVMPNVGIFKFIEKRNSNITIIPLVGAVEEVSSLFDKGNKFNSYEDNIFNLCKTDEPNFNPFRPLGKDKNENLSEYCDKYISKRWKDNNVFLITNLANGGMNGTFISSAVGQICKNKNELKSLMLKRRGACCTIMSFKSIKAANNCKTALQNNVLRFLLYRLQDDQNMTKRVYVCVPNIDWSDDRVKTDEGLLQVCGCPADKAKEYAEYCKKIIEEVDKK